MAAGDGEVAAVGVRNDVVEGEALVVTWAGELELGPAVSTVERAGADRAVALPAEHPQLVADVLEAQSDRGPAAGVDPLVR